MFGDSSFKLNHDDNTDGDEKEKSHGHHHPPPTREEAEAAGLMVMGLVTFAMRFGPCSMLAVIDTAVHMIKSIANGGDPNAPHS